MACMQHAPDSKVPHVQAMGMCGRVSESLPTWLYTESPSIAVEDRGSQQFSL